MQSSGIGAGAGDDVSAIVSASSLTTVATTGTHVIKINGYSAAKLAMARGWPAKSCEFEAAGHTWCILFYPNGNGHTKEVADHISLFLRLVAGNVSNEVVKARFRFSLVPHHCNDGGGAAGAKNKRKAKPNKRQLLVPYIGQCHAEVWFSRTNAAHGFPCFIRREELEKSEYLVDDSFVVRCDINSFAVRSAIEVVEMSAVSDLATQFRLSPLLPWP